jgi:hypothetical protein
MITALWEGSTKGGLFSESLGKTRSKEGHPVVRNKVNKMQMGEEGQGPVKFSEILHSILAGDIKDHAKNLRFVLFKCRVHFEGF